MTYELAASPDLALSFQRYPFPGAAPVVDLPVSRGALPVIEYADRRVLVPSRAGEAFWIGLVATGPRAAIVTVSALTLSGQRLDAAPGGLLVPPARAVPGISRPEGGWWPFARHTGDTSGPATAVIDLVIRRGPPRAAATADPRIQHGHDAAGAGAAGSSAAEDPGSRGAQGPATEQADERVAGAVTWRVELVEPEEHRALGGPPLPEPDSGYGGHRLP